MTGLLTCTHPSSTGFSPTDGPSTITCRECRVTWATGDPEATYELEVNLMRYEVDFIEFRSWTGRRWLDGQPYEGPVYNWLTPREA